MGEIKCECGGGCVDLSTLAGEEYVCNKCDKKYYKKPELIIEQKKPTIKQKISYIKQILFS